MLKVAPPAINVDRPGWLMASTYELCGHVFMDVYRSLELRVTDDWYRPVADLLERFDWDVVEDRIVETEDYWSGKAELVTYACKIL